MIKWIRPIISLIGMLAITIGFFIKLIPSEAYLALVTGVIVWWYKSRDEEKRNGNK